MIKTLGFGRRNPSLSHEQCIQHHRDTHSKLGLGQADHIAKYVLYYFWEARSASGAALTDYPWDMAAVEWFSEDERWYEFQRWLEAEPDGQVIKADEEQFLDRDRCYLLACDEDEIVVDEAGADDVAVIRVLRSADGTDAAAAAKHHRERFAPLVRDEFGPSLKRYVASYVVEATCLAHGRIPESPMDIIEIYTFDRSFMEGFERISDPFDAARLVEGESPIVDRERTIIFRGEEVVYI